MSDKIKKLDFFKQRVTQSAPAPQKTDDGRIQRWIIGIIRYN